MHSHPHQPASAWKKARLYLGNILAILALLLVGALLVDELGPQQDQTLAQNRSGSLTIAWESQYPYQYEVGDTKPRQLSGLDTELVRAAFDRAGYDVEFVPRVWTVALEEVESGAIDGVSLAFKTPEREQFAYYSEPFFTVRTAFFFRADRFARIPSSAAELIGLLREEGLTLGYSRGYAYVPEIVALLKEPTVAANSRASDSDGDSLSALMDGSIDIVLADQLSGTSVVMKNNWHPKLVCLLPDVPIQNIHLMLSKKSVKPEVVNAFNEAFAEMSADGTRASIVRSYYYPTIIGLLAHTFWLDEISVLAAAAAAVSGIFLARKMGTNLVGAFLLAAAPAVGGGLIRDLIAGRRPVGVVSDSSTMLVVVFLVLAGFLVFRVVDKHAPKSSAALTRLDIDRHPLLVLFDALGLSAFTVLGVLTAMEWNCEPLWLWGPLLAATTNGGGSAIRDLILRRPMGIVHSTQPYVEVSVFWGWLLSCYLIYSSGNLPYGVKDMQFAMTATLLGVGITYFGLRMSGARSPSYGVIGESPQEFPSQE